MDSAPNRRKRAYPALSSTAPRASNIRAGTGLAPPTSVPAASASCLARLAHHVSAQMRATSHGNDVPMQAHAASLLPAPPLAPALAAAAILRPLLCEGAHVAYCNHVHAAQARFCTHGQVRMESREKVWFVIQRHVFDAPMRIVAR